TCPDWMRTRRWRAVDGRRWRPVIWEGAWALAALTRRGSALGLGQALLVFQAEGWPPQAAKVLATGQWSAPIGRVGMRKTHLLRRPAGRSPRRCGCCFSLLARCFSFDLKDPRPR